MNVEVPEVFHSLIAAWFRDEVGKPTDIQLKAWPEIAIGNNLLITAPTGSGKTLCAFLYAINQLVTGSWENGCTKVLYISPLKALNNDIRKNLINPLQALRGVFEKNGIAFPEINVLTRSGDTSASDRRRMIKKPPEILITTPESLNIMLTTAGSRSLFGGIKTVILDEIHAIAGGKRGTHLITAIDRLVPLAGEFQRIALSATVRPLQEIADFVGGYAMTGSGADLHYQKRDIGILSSKMRKLYAVRVDCPKDADALPGDDRWTAVAEYVRQIINKNSSTLVFVNSRQFCEKITRMLNGSSEEPLAYAHHGSLSKEIRLAVEDRLKKGELKAIVATSSLELGIDVGELDEVVLVQTPFSLSGSIQRIGRAGHSVNQASTGVLIPTFEKDFINAAVTAKSIISQDIEEVHPVDSPLDILTQIILAMTSVQEWKTEELYAILKSSWPYRNLAKRNFDLVVEMLSGKFADTRIRELKPRIYLDALTDTIRARENSLFLLYTSGGTIPDRGYYNLRLADSKAKIGELDEEFTWERSIGDVFTLGTQVWQIKQITQNDVLVGPSDKALNMVPFWKADDRNRDFYFSEKLICFLEEINERLDDKTWLSGLKRESFFSENAVENLVGFLKRQKQNTGCALPSRHHIVVEYYNDPLKVSDFEQVVVHTLWGGMLNRPFAYALVASLEEKYDMPIQYFVNNDSILLIFPSYDGTIDIFGQLNSSNFDKHLRKKLESTTYFAAKFRHNAGRSLLLPTGSFRSRVPLWLTRIRAQKIMDAVFAFRDFPVLLETWRECLNDDFDIPNLKMMLDEIEKEKIKISHVTTSVISPFSSDMVWLSTNQFLYTYDKSGDRGKSSLSDDLIGEIIHSPHLRPRIPDDILNALDAKLKMTFAGYAPAGSDELLELVKDRLLITRTEWDELENAIIRDYGAEHGEEDSGDGAADFAAGLKADIAERIACIHLPGAQEALLCALENIPRIAWSLDMKIAETGPRPYYAFFGPASLDAKKREAADKSFQTNLEIIGAKNEGKQFDSGDFFLQWLGYHATVDAAFIENIFGNTTGSPIRLLDELCQNGMLIMDVFRESGNKLEICKTEVLEILLRMARQGRQPQFAALPVAKLQLFLAGYQGLTEKRDSVDGLQDVLDSLFGYPLRSELWEEAVLPARLDNYQTVWLESLFQSSRLVWYGSAPGRTAFAFEEDLELFLEANGEEDYKEIDLLFPTHRGKYSFFDLHDRSGESTAEITARLWENVWKSRISNDNITSLRKGILTKFKSGEASEKGPSRRRSFSRWQSDRPLAGNWFVLDRNFDPDPVEALELEKFRIRQLVARYGVIFRELLQTECPLLQWKNVFRTLRLMELSGEILSGHFFDGIMGVQFISQEAFSMLQQSCDEDAVYWLNAADPASLCGVNIEQLKAGLPYRQATTWLVYHGSRLVVTAKRKGMDLEIRVPPDSTNLAEYLAFFRVLLTRRFNPLKKIVVETINEKDAGISEYAEALKKFGFRPSFARLELWKM